MDSSLFKQYTEIYVNLFIVKHKGRKAYMFYPLDYIIQPSSVSNNTLFDNTSFDTKLNIMLSEINKEFPDLQRTKMQDFYLYHVDDLPSSHIIDDNTYNEWLANVLEYYEPLPDWLSDRYSVEFQLIDDTTNKPIEILYTFVCKSNTTDPKILKKTKERERKYTEIVKKLNNNYSIINVGRKIISIPTLVQWILKNNIIELSENREELFNYIWNENVELYKIISHVSENENFATMYGYYREYILVDLLTHQYGTFDECYDYHYHANYLHDTNNLNNIHNLRKQCLEYAITNNYDRFNYFKYMHEMYKNKFPQYETDIKIDMTNFILNLSKN